MNRLRCGIGLADSDDSIKLIPTNSPKLDTSFAKSQIEVQLRDVTILYTPVLSRFKLETAFGVTPANPHKTAFDLLGNPNGESEEDEQLFRLSCHIALQFNHLQLSVTPMDKRFEL